MPSDGVRNLRNKEPMPTGSKKWPATSNPLSPKKGTTYRISLPVSKIKRAGAPKTDRPTKQDERRPAKAVGSSQLLDSTALHSLEADLKTSNQVVNRSIMASLKDHSKLLGAPSDRKNNSVAHSAS